MVFLQLQTYILLQLADVQQQRRLVCAIFELFHTSTRYLYVLVCLLCLGWLHKLLCQCGLFYNVEVEFPTRLALELYYYVIISGEVETTHICTIIGLLTGRPSVAITGNQVTAMS